MGRVGGERGVHEGGSMTVWEKPGVTWSGCQHS
jgi:hypothetical protein